VALALAEVCFYKLASNEVSSDGPILRRLQTWLGSAAVTVSAIAISQAWLDKPIAILAHDLFGRSSVVGEFTQTPSFYSPLVTSIFVVFMARRLAFRPFVRFDVALILSDLSIILAKLIVPPLKFVFGRTWPIYHHPSFIYDGVYGFNFFHPGPAYESFPSGHMASVCALVIVLWMYYPRLWPVYAVCAGGLAGALILGNYHFLSDVIAGAFVGSSTAVLIVAIWEALERCAFLTPWPGSDRAHSG
jgi:membrane-associated phospholipid phosphatase